MDNASFVVVYVVLLSTNSAKLEHYSMLWLLILMKCDGHIPFMT